MTVGSYISEIAEAFGTYPQVLAVALSGSRLSAHSDEQSDYDLYVYTLSDLPIAFRRSLAGENGELDNRTWEHGDEWIDLSTGSRVDVMYRSPSWIQDRLDDVLQHHRASLGYSTSFWYNVLHSEPLFDPRGWYRDLQQHARVPYPPQLRRAIIAKNEPVLRRNHSSYRRQLEIALHRNDLVSLQHRLTAMLSSVFDIWFALQQQPHPGEKRLLTYLSPDWAAAVRSALEALPCDLLVSVDRLIDLVESSVAEVPVYQSEIDHAALWVTNLERSRAFYEQWFGAKAGPRYDSKQRPFSSYFLTLQSGSRLELMTSPAEPAGSAHLAISVGSREKVDELTRRMSSAVVLVLSQPRQTGDGYYESVVADPDGNPIEITSGETP